MSRFRLEPWALQPEVDCKTLAASLAGTAALMGGAMLFAWSGLYDIAASGGHWKIVEKFLEFGLPSPPDLSASMRPWKEHELFWIVKHGFKYTGMPGWVALEREDEIWAVVAFLTRLPAFDAESYRDLALGDVRVSPRSGSELATFESNPEAISACARCHGGEGERPKSNLVSVLHGQPADYLFSALKTYAECRRPSGIMQPLAADSAGRGHPQPCRNEQMDAVSAYLATGAQGPETLLP